LAKNILGQIRSDLREKEIKSAIVAEFSEKGNSFPYREFTSFWRHKNNNLAVILIEVNSAQKN